MERITFHALLMGLLIGLAALMLESLVGDRGWLGRIVTLLFVGGLLCALQFWLLRLRRRR